MSREKNFFPRFPRKSVTVFVLFIFFVCLFDRENVFFKLFFLLYFRFFFPFEFLVDRNLASELLARLRLSPNDSSTAPEAISSVLALERLGPRARESYELRR